jgi:hypothetical protein
VGSESAVELVVKTVAGTAAVEALEANIETTVVVLERRKAVSW